MDLFDKKGKLLPGIHSMPGDDFIEIFCEKGNRTEYKQAIINIFDFAKDKGAGRIIIGGSFISLKGHPHDLDCMIVFHRDVQIPSFLDCAQMDNIEYDILYSSEQTPQLIDSYIKLVSTDYYGNESKGVIEIILNP